MDFSQTPASFALIIANVVVSALAFMKPELWSYLALEPYAMPVVA